MLLQWLKISWGRRPNLAQVLVAFYFATLACVRHRRLDELRLLASDTIRSRPGLGPSACCVVKVLYNLRCFAHFVVTHSSFLKRSVIYNSREDDLSSSAC